MAYETNINEHQIYQEVVNVSLVSRFFHNIPMKWIVPGPNAKVLAQAIHCLAKLGEDLYIEGRPEKLCFRTVNLPKTAFASFNFQPDFFSFYPVVPSDGWPRCQISMKAALVVFRFPSGMERSVENCAIGLQSSDDVVEFRLKFKQGFVKSNKIQLLETEVLHASYEDEVLPSQVVMEPKVMADFLSSFHSPEISWAVTKNGVQFRNFSELVDDGSGLRSEIFFSGSDIVSLSLETMTLKSSAKPTLSPGSNVSAGYAPAHVDPYVDVYVGKDELLELTVSEDVEITFCLAELRTVLNFAEHIGCPIAVSFSESGKPLFFIVKNQVLICHVVLSTLGLSSTQSTSNLANTSQPLRPVSQEQPQAIVLSQDNRRILDSQDENSQSSQCNGRFEVLKRVLRRADYDITKLPGYDVILAPDSDEEM